MGYIKEKDLTKHVCQVGKLSLQTGILPGFWLLCIYIPERGALNKALSDI